MATVLSSAGSLCNNEARVKVDQQAAGRVVVTFPRPRPIFGDTRLTCPRVHPLVSTRDENPSRDRSARSLARAIEFIRLFHFLGESANWSRDETTRSRLSSGDATKPRAYEIPEERIRDGETTPPARGDARKKRAARGGGRTGRREGDRQYLRK